MEDKQRAYEIVVAGVRANQHKARESLKLLREQLGYVEHLLFENSTQLHELVIAEQYTGIIKNHEEKLRK